ENQQQHLEAGKRLVGRFGNIRRLGFARREIELPHRLPRCYAGRVVPHDRGGQDAEASACGCAVGDRNAPVPTQESLQHVAAEQRDWHHVLRDQGFGLGLSCQAPIPVKYLTSYEVAERLPKESLICVGSDTLATR